jgi:hypothetical protein
MAGERESVMEAKQRFLIPLTRPVFEFEKMNPNKLAWLQQDVIGIHDDQQDQVQQQRQPTAGGRR